MGKHKELSFEDEKEDENIEESRKKSQAIKEIYLEKIRQILSKTHKKRTEEEWENFDVDF